MYTPHLQILVATNLLKQPFYPNVSYSSIPLDILTNYKIKLSTIINV